MEPPLTRKPRPRRPLFDDIQRKWRFLFVTGEVLPVAIDPRVTPAIAVLRQSEHCVELIANTMQKGDGTTNLSMFSVCIWGFLWLAFFGICMALDFHNESLQLLVLFLEGPMAVLLYVGLLRLSPVGRYRTVRVRINRQNRRVYFVPYAADSPEPLLVIDWDTVQGVRPGSRRGPMALYLAGYTCNLHEPQLAKTSVLSTFQPSGKTWQLSNVIDSRWAWLQRYMAFDPTLPPPVIEPSPPRSVHEVFMRHGGNWIAWTFTSPWGRWLLPFTIWLDLCLLIVMPVIALPQLIILLCFPELTFPPENDLLCGFPTADGKAI